MVNSFWRAAVGEQSKHRVATLNHGGFKMSCDLSEILQRQFYFFGTYLVEEDILRCWESAAKGARFIFDVGAKAGIYSWPHWLFNGTLPYTPSNPRRKLLFGCEKPQS